MLARVAQTSSNTLLDEAALVSLRELRFVPYFENGVALPVTVVAPMTFKFYDRPR